MEWERSSAWIAGVGALHALEPTAQDTGVVEPTQTLPYHGTEKHKKGTPSRKMQQNSASEPHA